MKVLVATLTNSHVGGVERYLELALSALDDRGHRVGCLFERAGVGQGSIRVSESSPVWTIASATNGRQLFREMELWSPDIVYCHGLLDPVIERWLQSLAPAVLFAHDYYGTCISGTKTCARPTSQPCRRKFGPRCLALYLPRGCGGKNPLSMWSQYKLQRCRSRQLANYRAICTASKHMADEFDKQLGTKQTKIVRLPISKSTSGIDARRRALQERLKESLAILGRPIRLLFLGRIEPNKGPHVAIAAAPLISKRLNRSVELTLIGEGSQSSALRSSSRSDGRARIAWRGWMTGESLEREIARHDLLLVPSLWPEPFGLVGLECGRWGVPAASFGRGGIVDWLIDGETGVIASGPLATPESLADAAVKCLVPVDDHRRLSSGAMRLAEQWPDGSWHATELTALFQSLVSTSG